jgi:hypothetical protein
VHNDCCGDPNKEAEPVSDLDFYADVLRAGTVLGLDAHSTPEQVTDVLGGDFGEFRMPRVLVRDFGLVEFSWERSAVGESWRGLRFSVQVHRLERAGSNVVNPALTRAYGDFAAELPRWGRLREMIDPKLWPIDERPSTDPSLRELWQADSEATVLLGPHADPASTAVDELPLYQLSIGRTRVRTGTQNRRSVLDHVGHLQALSESARLDWLARRRPSAAEEQVNWWLHHVEMAKFRISEQREDRRTWIGLTLWLIEQGEQHGVFTALDTAQQRAWFVSELHHRYASLPADVGIPDGDALVGACLAVIPGTRGDLARRIDLHSLSRSEMLRSRRARNLIRAAEQHRDRIHDPQLAAELAQWTALRPELV